MQGLLFVMLLMQGGQATLVRHGVTLPSTCTANADYFSKDGDGLYWCSAPNIWSKVGGSGSGPAGSGTELQSRNGSSLGAVSGSSYSGTVLGLPQFSVNLSDPNVTNDTNNHIGANFSCNHTTTIGTGLNPVFDNLGCLAINMTGGHGNNSYGGGSDEKTTFLPFSITGDYEAAGQLDLYGNFITCHSYGSDCSVGQDFVSYIGGNVQGNEGQGFKLDSHLGQQDHLDLATVTTVPTPTTLNTTLTQNVTRSKDPQTVTVASTTGCSTSGLLAYAIVQQQVSSSQANIEAIKITACGSGTITAIFSNNHSSGTTITPPLLLTLDTVYGIGQNRLIINRSATPYTAGTVASINGGGFIGSSTAWSNGMVGGSPTNIGAVCLDADDYGGDPFFGMGQVLHSCYPITVVASATSLGIYRSDTALDGAYRGKGPGSGTYKIYPAARALDRSGFTLILESTSTAWHVSDSVEAGLGPDADVHGMTFDFAHYTNGATLRHGMLFRNLGPRTFESGLVISSSMPPSGSDAVGWETGINLSSVNNGVLTTTASGGAFIARALSSGGSDTPMFSFIDYNFGGDVHTYGLRGNGATREISLLGVGGTDVTITTTGASGGLNVVRVGGHLTVDGGPAARFPISTLTGGFMNSSVVSTTLTDSGAITVHGSRSTSYDHDINSQGGVVSLRNEVTDQLASVIALAAPSFATATNAASNSISGLTEWCNSVWTGSAAANRCWKALANPGVSGNNAATEWQLDAPSPSNVLGFGAYFYDSVFFGVNNQGKVRFGEFNGLGSIDNMVTLDPTTITAARVVSAADVNGTMVVSSTATSAFKCPTGQMAPVSVNDVGQLVKGTCM